MRRPLTKTQTKNLVDALEYIKKNRSIITAYALVVVSADEQASTMVSFDRCIDVLGAVQLLDAKIKLEVVDGDVEEME